MENKKIKLERRRAYSFTVNCPITKKTYFWPAAIANKKSIVEVSQETYDYLFMQTTAFKGGDLIVLDETALEELKVAISEEEYETLTENTNTREDVITILESNTNSMKAALKKITNSEEKNFVITVAREIKIDSSSKRNFLNEWNGTEIDFED